MVMHARKQSKLSDGYPERNDSHMHDYHRSVYTHDSQDDGHPHGDHVSPRYQNKPSYTERHEEKQTFLSFAEKKVSHYLANGSLGRPVSLDNVTFTGEHFSITSIPDTQRSAVLSAGQRKERSGSQDDRSLGDCSNQLGSMSDCRSLTNSSSKLGDPTKHASKSSSNLHPTGGNNNNSHSEKDNITNSNILASNGKQTATIVKDKEQVQKSAIRVCGDWSEHISSSGKRYYYNCKTEVSQWEKPKEWNNEMCRTPDHRSKDGRPRSLLQSHANKVTPDGRTSRHSIEHQQTEHTRSHRIDNGDAVTEPQHGRSISTSNTHHYNRESWHTQQLSGDGSHDISKRDMTSNDLHKPIVERAPSTSTNSHLHYQHQQVASHRTASTCGSNGLSDLQHMDNKHNGHHSHGEYKRYGGDTHRRRRTDSQGSQKYDIDHGPVDDMEISPSLSPTSSSHISSATSTPQLPPTSTPSYNSSSNAGGSHYTSSPLGNPIPTLVNRQTVNGGGNHDRTMQTLQELQKVLSMHIRAQQNTVNSRPLVTQPHVGHPSIPVSSHQATSSHHLIYPAGQTPTVISRSPLGAQHQPCPVAQAQVPAVTGQVSGTQREEGTVGRISPMSGTSTRSSCGSPTPSDSSSKNATVNSQALLAVALKREETTKLTASLCNYYNETLIGHVLGWQADVVEKQAAKLWEESMIVGSEQCNRISVQLKRARSDVRIAEIQSTLHEQRIMSSDQQFQEIENLKIPYTFLPS